jgi:hypothetical protein
VCILSKSTDNSEDYTHITSISAVPAAWLLLVLLFDPENGGDTFLSNVDFHGTIYSVTQKITLFNIALQYSGPDAQHFVLGLLTKPQWCHHFPGNRNKCVMGI